MNYEVIEEKFEMYNRPAGMRSIIFGLATDKNFKRFDENSYPEFPFTQGKNYKIVQNTRDQGTIHRRARYDNVKQGFKLNWKNANIKDMRYLKRFVKNVNGSSIYFEFIPPDTADKILCKLSNDSFNYTESEHGNYQASMEFIEVF